MSLNFVLNFAMNIEQNLLHISKVQNCTAAVSLKYFKYYSVSNSIIIRLLFEFFKCLIYRVGYMDIFLFSILFCEIKPFINAFFKLCS